MRPPFIRVVPEEVEQHGAAAAIVLAHIRYRCESDGPDRIEHDGYRWWRVAWRDIGSELGMSRRTIRTAMQKLENAVLANHFPPLEDQSLAYRVARDDAAPTSQRSKQSRSDLPEVETVPDRDRNDPPPGLKRPLPVTETASALYIENLETRDKEGGEAGKREHETADPRNLPAQQNDRSPQSDSRGTRLPDGWKPNPDVIAKMRAEHPGIDLRAEHDKFTDHFRAKAGKDARKADWNAAWRNWIRGEAGFRHSRNTRNRASTADLRVEQTQALKRQPSQLELG